MNDDLETATMLEFLTFSNPVLQVIFLAGLIGCSWEGLRWAERRGIYHGSGFVGSMAGSAWFCAWFLVSGSIRLIAWWLS